VQELLTPVEMAEADRLTIASGTAGIALMELAGRAVAAAVLRHPENGPVLVVAGPGNNGGDGFVAARLLRRAGRQVRVQLVGDASRLRGDAALALQAYDGPIETADPAALGEPALIIDALFGAGLDRDVSDMPRRMIETMNAAKVPVVAVDLPSGIDGETGAVRGAAVSAAETVTFFRKKMGHVLLPGRDHCGPVTVADIGIAASVLDRIRPRTVVNDPALWRDAFPVPRSAGHKYSRGHAVVVSGGASTTGAARLAARGALRAGAGLVTIASPVAAMPVHAATNLAVMVRAVDDPQALSGMLEDTRFNAVVLGPGLGVGAATRDLVITALASEAAVVLDADALTSFAGALALLVAVLRRKPATIITPHQGEFSRLFKDIGVKAKPCSKLAMAREAAARSGAVVILKGADTVIAAPDGRAAINDNAPGWLATAGSGDVLAGMAAALCAQGMPGYEAACAAVWLHGDAATRFGPGLISEDIPEMLPAVYRDLFTSIARR
jgi:hydroxyethylthiazole kinase-like uncharacterized protein yjeF